MLPTPDTSHVPYGRVYEPAEDSFLMIDTLAGPTETAFLQGRFGGDSSSTPLVVEVGSGSGVVLAFVAAQAAHLFGRDGHVMSMAVDVNAFACRATAETVRRAMREEGDEEKTERAGVSFLGAVRADLVSGLRPGQVDVLLFNPPYVPSPELPGLPKEEEEDGMKNTSKNSSLTFARDCHLLALACDGGRDGMETTDRLLAALPVVLATRGCAYVLLCAQNRPEAVKERIRAWADEGGRWQAETVGSSGKQAGWEKLQIVRIWRD
ncbi:n-glutamine methyltransferase mtq2 [Grosmannia clavigera kw1407]|uniref:N-glutamine methyltransferase mtq2 n=1 Tax=Grosmannia clavigera (strain kw1407 / UAMH 11150) TaxID=655863 RepID=F0XE08_GROCL|nr:n-glutamine methyltransferase mtq2 [Grosmannia clavigera kw1407]EFX03919.1 n-glutamine methyltransferase mtq2 [Grosmannia clavigera kw1407]